jgi:uncharacterized cupredoxin-like copper-binding protein
VRVWKVGVIGSIAVAAFTLAACGGDDDDSPDDGIRQITVAASAELRFAPDEITVHAGEPVRLVVENTDEATLHDITFTNMPATDVHTEGGVEHEMDNGEATEVGHDGEEAEGGHEEVGAKGKEAAVHVAVDPGETATVAFTPDQPGEYEFLCTVGGHADAGMVGTIIVEA